VARTAQRDEGDHGRRLAHPYPQRGDGTADIKRSKLDIAYSFFLDNDVHHVSSKTALEGAIAALKAEAKRTGGSEDFPALELQDKAEVILADFRKFADAAGVFAARNRQIKPERFSDVAIGGMISTSPDCHTYFLTSEGAVIRSRPQPPKGSAARIPPGGTMLASGDEAGLMAKALPDGIIYITFREFVTSGTYRIADEVKKVMDAGLARGARAWLFDLRGNIGGRQTGADILTSFFLNGEPTLKVVFRNGAGGMQSALQAYRLPDSYQLPVAIILNDLGGSGPEVFAASLRENKRATIVGQKSTGCLGAVNQTRLPDGSELTVILQEYVGAQTGTAYNNNGVPPDVEADDATAVDKAIEVLKQKIGT
jgi:hypothetical protein